MLKNAFWLQKDTFPFQNLCAKKKKTLPIKKKNLSNYQANICLLKSVGHRYGGRESYLILIAPNILALVLNCRRSVAGLD